jgi:mRNA-degrading endonuclease RelE of RelBE toxin-antitoxin system
MKPKESNQEKKKENPSTTSSQNYKIICTPTFLKEAKELAKKYPNIKTDFLRLKDVIKKDPKQGEDLGYGLFKIRMEITDKGQGKSGGARVIIQVKVIDKIVYVLSTYDKAEYDTVITDVLKMALKKEEDKKKQQAKRDAKRKKK